MSPTVQVMWSSPTLPSPPATLVGATTGAAVKVEAYSRGTPGTQDV